MIRSLIQMEDKKLMLLYQNGNYMAFETLYLRHKDKVYSYLSKRIKDDDDTQDLFQKAFLKIHKSKNLYQSKYDVLPWFYVITKSVMLDFFKKKKFDTQEFSDDIHADLETNIYSAFDVDNESMLSVNEKEAIKLRYYNDSDFTEISKILNTSGSNSRKLISRGLKKLRTKYLKD